MGWQREGTAEFVCMFAAQDVHVGSAWLPERTHSVQPEGQAAQSPVDVR